MSLAESRLSLVDRNPTDFHSDGMWVLLPGSGALGWGSQLGNETPPFSGETFVAQISLQNLSHCPWEWGHLFVHLRPSYQS